MAPAGCQQAEDEVEAKRLVAKESPAQEVKGVERHFFVLFLARLWHCLLRE